jgi:hypothetical protein
MTRSTHFEHTHFIVGSNSLQNGLTRHHAMRVKQCSLDVFFLELRIVLKNFFNGRNARRSCLMWRYFFANRLTARSNDAVLSIW